MHFQNTIGFCFLLGVLSQQVLLAGIGMFLLGLQFCLGAARGLWSSGLVQPRRVLGCSGVALPQSQLCPPG